ncbi:hypothetical protein FQR65_LT03004 [Abscondita terminalis]|nr:hypothetical protein FQR65_LT03004 [Abscondita terminalis]
MYFFILHLSVADLITAFLSVLPQLGWEVTYRFNGGFVLCKIVKFGQTLGPYLSSYILMATAIDRHQAICYPLTYCSWTSRRSKVMVWLAWGVSLTFCVPQLTIFSYQEVDPGVYDCWATFPQEWGAKAYVTWYGISIFIVPLLVLIVTYTCICREIWRSSAGELGVRHRQSYHTKPTPGKRIPLISRAKINTVKQTVAVIVMHIVCSTPFISAQLWATWDPHAYQSPFLDGPAFTILTLLYSLNSCVNPWIYLAFNRELPKLLLRHYTGSNKHYRSPGTVYVPSSKSLTDQIRRIPELHDDTFTELHFEEESQKFLILPSLYNNQIIIYTIIEYKPLCDSSNVSIIEWVKIATDIETYYHQYDGFVIIHGTDTLAYSASALSFMLEDLQKPIILTGSQIPIFINRSDAKANFLSSLIICACYKIPEVCIYFANKLLRGNHILFNFIQITVHYHYILQSNLQKTLTVHKNLNPNVVLLPLFPTITGEMIERYINFGVEGVVLQSYGVGNVPSNRKDVMDVLQKAVAKGIIIVNITQCTQGKVISSYEPGRALKEIGIISGLDMTPEAALSKLTFLLGQNHLSLEEKKQSVTLNLRGELTEEDFHT